ncbi:MAG: Basic proline-rich protein precursor, partial [Mycobacterium sp.]|nr:Basic proline-rich protein precursor [Mycobacterium sp.]
MLRGFGRFFVGLLMAGSLVGAAVQPPASAEPPGPPPAEPAIPAPPATAGRVLPGLGLPLGSQGLSVLQQTGSPPLDALGTPALPELNPQYALGQHPVPRAPGAPPPPGPNLNVFN